MKTHQNPLKFVCFAVPALAIIGCGASSKPAAAPVIPQVTVTTVRATEVPNVVELPGRTTPFKIAQVRARVDGIVQERTYKEGSDVKAGQPLYLIDPQPYRAALDSAMAAQQKTEATLAVTTSQLDRYAVLVKANAVSQQEYDNAVAAKRQAAADVAGAKAAVEDARIKLGYTSVTAPISGRSDMSSVTQGAYVQASGATLMTTIEQLDPIYVDVTQASKEALRLSESAAGKADSAPVNLVLEDGSRYPIPGKLDFNGATVDPATGSIHLRATFPNPQHKLLPGMFVRAELIQGRDHAILVPVSAIGHNPRGDATALVVQADNTEVERTVTATRMLGNDWVVSAGLSDGNQVVIKGARLAQPGAKVRPVGATLAAK